MLSVCFLHSGSRVVGPETEHESFFWVADLVYAADDSARNKKSAALVAKVSLTPGVLSASFTRKIHKTSPRHFLFCFVQRSVCVVRRPHDDPQRTKGAFEPTQIGSESLLSHQEDRGECVTAVAKMFTVISIRVTVTTRSIVVLKRNQ